MFSRAKEKRETKKAPWPDLRYNIATGEAKLFFKPEEVPKGWVKKQAIQFKKKPQIVHNKQGIINELLSRGVFVDPKWGTAHLQKVLNDLSSPR